MVGNGKRRNLHVERESVERVAWVVERLQLDRSNPSSASSTVSLSFPLLGGSCSATTPTEACYESTDDVSGLAAESIDLSDGGEYEVEGTDPITLEAGGLTSQPGGTETGYAVLGLPLTLGATQTWHLAGSSRESLANHLFLLEGEVKGASSRLSVMAEKSVEFAIGADVNVGPVNIEGVDASGNRDANAIVGVGGGGSLNWSDGSSVRLAHIFFFGSGKVGPVSTEGTTLVVGSGQAKPGVLEAGGVTLDRESAAEFEARSGGDVVGTDYSQLSSTGDVSLNSAALAMVVPKLEGEACSLTPGSTYTLVSTTGELTGSFGNAPEGGEIPVSFETGCGSIPAQKLEIAYHRSGATKTVTATVIADSTTSLSMSPESPVSYQPVTLDATVSAEGAEPAGTVTFEDGGSALPGCSDVPVTHGSNYTASCQTSFLAEDSPERLSAAYTPATGRAVVGSSSAPKTISVGFAGTTTTLSASSLTPAEGQQVSYIATVCTRHRSNARWADRTRRALGRFGTDRLLRRAAAERGHWLLNLLDVHGHLCDSRAAHDHRPLRRRPELLDLHLGRGDGIRCGCHKRRTEPRRTGP